MLKFVSARLLPTLRNCEDGLGEVFALERGEECRRFPERVPRPAGASPEPLRFETGHRMTSQ